MPKCLRGLLTRTILIALAFSALPPVLGADEALELEGTWVVESATDDGKATGQPVGDKLIFAGDKLTIEPKSGSKRHVVVKIDVSKDPHHIDMTHEVAEQKLVVQGLIEVKGDKAILALSRPGTPRPTSLESQSGSVTLVLERSREAARTVRLFNGKDLTGWTPFLWDGKAQDTTTPADSVWTVKEGVLICSGRPTGYLKTTAAYENYKLELEWRWPEGTERGNSGVLVHVTTPNELGQWPKSIEAQLYTGNAGDFWAIGTTLTIPDMEKRKKGRRHVNLTDDSEKPIGQWNKMEITCRGKEILVHVNGDLVNHATESSDTKGRIALQSEGRPIHFRNITLTPLAKDAAK